jgi:hypothetical protein
MIKEKVKNISAYILILLVFIISALYFYLFEFDYLFEPTPIDIKLEEGAEVKFDFDVQLSCVYLVGIRFVDKNGGHEKIKKIFIDKNNELGIQGSIDIKILSSNNEIVFERNNLGEGELKIQYGPNPIGFIAGHLYMAPGTYSVIININHFNKKYEYFNAKFFVEMNRKIKCQ